MAEPPGGDILTQFDTLLDQCRILRAVCGTSESENFTPYFYNRFRLKNWMGLRVHHQEKTNGQRLLESIAIVPEEFTEISLDGNDQLCCALLLACLRTNKDERLLPIFRRLNFDDKQLDRVIDPQERRLIIQRLNKAEGPLKGGDILKNFERQRMAFVPKVIDGDLNPDLQQTYPLRQRILPYCRQQILGQGGTARVYQVLVPADFIHEDTKKYLPKEFDFDPYGMCHELAIKTFLPGQDHAFDREILAYRGLRGKPGVLRCFGSYEAPAHGNMDSEMTYNLILEHSSMDLSKLYNKMPPPSTTGAIIDSWAQLFEVAKTIRRVHRLRSSGGEEYDGCHGDIKPENILVFFDESGRQSFKLADFGFTQFAERIGSGSNTRKIQIHGGTETYGAPDPDEVDFQRVDIWSFGCVLLEHATWIISGLEGLWTLSELRETANAPYRSDMFYNPETKEVLKEVVSWNSHLKSLKRANDEITSHVLSLIKGFLLIKQDRRLEAEDLCIKLDTILDIARNSVDLSDADPVLAVALENARLKSAKHLEILQQESAASSKQYNSKSRTVSRVTETAISGTQSTSLPEPHPDPGTSTGPDTMEVVGGPASHQRDSLSRSKTQGTSNEDAVITEPDNSSGSMRRKTPSISTISLSEGSGTCVPTLRLASRAPPDEQSLFFKCLKEGDDSYEKCAELLGQYPHLAKEHSTGPDCPNPAMVAARGRKSSVDKLLRLLIPYTHISETDEGGSNVLHHLAAGLLARVMTLSKHETTSLIEIFQHRTSQIINEPNALSRVPFEETKFHPKLVTIFKELNAEVTKPMLITAIQNDRIRDHVAIYLEKYGGLSRNDVDKTIFKKLPPVLKQLLERS